MPAFSSSVHTHETNGFDADDDAPSEPALTSYQRFRHRGWAGLRQKVANLLALAGFNTRQIARFDACGQFASLWNSPSTGMSVIQGSFCKCRFCAPCAAARSSLISGNLISFLADRPTRFLTLTLKHREVPLGKAITRLWQCFKRMRATEEWHDHVTGFVAFLEAKYSPRTKGWHVHLHCLLEGSFWQQREISQTWAAVTGDSFIVDIQAKGTNASRAYYGAKYAAKPVDVAGLEEPQLVEALREFRSRRLWLVGGGWKGKLRLLARSPLPKDLGYVCSLNDLLDAVEDGNEQARQVWAEVSRIEERNTTRGPPP